MVMKMLDRLERILAAKGIRQGELERSLGLSENRISKWKSGQGEPTARQAWKIARALGVPLEWLVSEDGSLDPPDPETGEVFTPEEEAVAYIFRNSEIDLAEATRRLMAPAQKVSGKRRRN